VNDPRYSTVLGLLKMAVEDGVGGKKRKKVKLKSNEPGMVEKMQKRLVQGVIGFFEENQADTEIT